MLERRNEVLCVLTEKIVTTQKCVVSEHVQVEEKCGGMVGIRTKTVQVWVCPRLGPQLLLWLQLLGPRSGSSLGGVFVHQDFV